MAAGYSEAIANAIIDALCRGVAWTPPAALWVKLHIGDPGAAGASNPAVETTRIQATFGTAAAGGTIANTVALVWPSVAADEDYTYYSVWDDETAGTFQFSGPVTAAAVTAGQSFTVAIGDMNVSFGVAA